MHVLFVEPAFPRNQQEFVRGLRQVGAKVTAIGEAPASALPRGIREHLHGYEQVRSVVDKGALYDTVRAIQDREWVDRLEATVEAHMLPVAEVREACEIPGTSVRTTFLCRDKPAMKHELREAGVACAQSTGASDAETVRAFAEKEGYPLILKPLDAAGAAGTYRVDNDEELGQAIQVLGVDRGRAIAVEEFIEGHEGFYDTLTCGGRVVHDFACHYYPNVLEAMRHRWISPQIVLTNQLDSNSNYDEVKEMGRKVIETFGIETSATHMEWFFGPKGLKFSEIGCRPPGVRVWDLYAQANGIDIYREWAQLIVHGQTGTRCSREFAAGMIALRPECDGTITGYEGLETIRREMGQWILDEHTPPPGTKTQGVDAGYMANAYIRMRHPDFDTLRQMLDRIGDTVKVRARST